MNEWAMNELMASIEVTRLVYSPSLISFTTNGTQTDTEIKCIKLVVILMLLWILLTSVHLMKKLKKRFNAVFRGNDLSSASPDSTYATGSIKIIYREDCIAVTNIKKSHQKFRNWTLSDSMSELAERLAADGVIIEECDIPPGFMPKAGFPILCMNSKRLPASISRQFHSDYSRNLKAYSPTQHQYSSFPRQSCKYE
ncbi:unnamed protein product [Thelazia callipaeda]|uniref:Doublecortin domain-containing protein n=1 Tax=Thelazia callipaeda TaxID=103827 RepID=A0A0N5CYI7_THECL|nr:unnamed protein product [Thelazia callipaeda]